MHTPESTTVAPAPDTPVEEWDDMSRPTGPWSAGDEEWDDMSYHADPRSTGSEEWS